MNIDDMNMVITGAIGYLTTYSLGYFSHKVAFIVGTARQLSKTTKPKKMKPALFPNNLACLLSSNRIF